MAIHVAWTTFFLIATISRTLFEVTGEVKEQLISIFYDLIEGWERKFCYFVKVNELGSVRKMSHCFWIFAEHIAIFARSKMTNYVEKPILSKWQRMSMWKVTFQRQVLSKWQVMSDCQIMSKKQWKFMSKWQCESKWKVIFQWLLMFKWSVLSKREIMLKR